MKNWNVVPGAVGQHPAVAVLERRGAHQIPAPPGGGYARHPAGADRAGGARQLPRVLPPAGPSEDQLPALGTGEEPLVRAMITPAWLVRLETRCQLSEPARSFSPMQFDSPAWPSPHAQTAAILVAVFDPCGL